MLLIVSIELPARPSGIAVFDWPGLGTYAGKLGWKSSGQYQAA